MCSNFYGLFGRTGGCIHPFYTEVLMKSHSPSSDVRTLIHEKLDAMLDEGDLVMENADFGQVLNDLLGITDCSVGLRSLAARAGADCSFQKAAETLHFY